MYYLQIHPTQPSNPQESTSPAVQLPVERESNGLPEQIQLNGNQSSELLNYINVQRVVQTLHKTEEVIEQGTNAMSISVIKRQCDDNEMMSQMVNPANVQNPVTDGSTLALHDERIKQNNLKIQNFVHIADRVVPPRAVAVLPAELQLRNNVISSRKTLPARTRFGPVEGINTKITQSEASKLTLEALKHNRPIFLCAKDKQSSSVTHIDVTDKDKSNWMGLLPLGNQDTANMWIYEENAKLYGVTTTAVRCKTPLTIGYSNEYSDDYDLPSGQPILDLGEELMQGPRLWSCRQCNRNLPSSTLLTYHMEIYHQVGTRITRYPHRCKYCAQKFSRLSTYKRHLARHCPKKPKKGAKLPSPPEQKSTVDKNDSLTELALNASSEDARNPSDESFQNYTNNIDFPISLFDTLRIPSLDISGSSRSENDYNPYGLTYKNENSLPNDLSFSKLTVKSEVKDAKSVKREVRTKVATSCTDCDQPENTEKKRAYVKACPDTRLECHCGLRFQNNKKLALHVQTAHPFKPKPEPQETADTPYKCDECKLFFIRRGMLVNHLWRVHNSTSIAVPFERRVRHYPCVACPKVYRTAAKRNWHVKKHHPEANLTRGQTIEGAVMSLTPAACPACPRQYATRAKLLQHCRTSHPAWKNDASQDSTSSQLAEAHEVAFTQTLAEPLTIGSHLVCTGTPNDDFPWFSINIGSGDAGARQADLAVHFNVRLPQCYVVRNARRHGKWGPEETTAHRSFPFKVGRPFTIEMVVDESETLWAIDGEHYCGFAHRNPKPFAAAWVQVTGIRDAELQIRKTDVYPVFAPSCVEVPFRPNKEDPPSDDEPSWRPNVIANLSRGIPEDHQLIIHGRLRPLLHSFAIDLADSAQSWPHSNIHLHVNIRAHDQSFKERQLVVLNAHFGAWGNEIRQRTARLIPGTKTTFRIVHGPAGWSIFADDMLIGELNYRASPAGIKCLRLRGDLYPEQIYICPTVHTPLMVDSNC